MQWLVFTFYSEHMITKVIETPIELTSPKSRPTHTLISYKYVSLYYVMIQFFMLSRNKVHILRFLK